jgi:hypothetical protein
MTKLCFCGNTFETTEYKVRTGRGKFCSRSCSNTYWTGRHKDSGVGNRKRGSDHYKWKGDNVGRVGLHYWVRSQLGTPNQCEFCSKSEGRLEWANKSGEYKRDISDWLRLCPPCHRRYDSHGTGAYYHKGSGKWLAGIRYGGKNRYLGQFDCKEDAAARTREERERVYRMRT